MDPVGFPVWAAGDRYSPGAVGGIVDGYFAGGNRDRQGCDRRCAAQPTAGDQPDESVFVPARGTASLAIHGGGGGRLGVPDQGTGRAGHSGRSQPAVLRQSGRVAHLAATGCGLAGVGIVPADCATLVHLAIRAGRRGVFAGLFRASQSGPFPAAAGGARRRLVVLHAGAAGGNVAAYRRVVACVGPFPAAIRRSPEPLFADLVRSGVRAVFASGHQAAALSDVWLYRVVFADGARIGKTRPGGLVAVAATAVSGVVAGLAGFDGSCPAACARRAGSRSTRRLGVSARILSDTGSGFAADRLFHARAAYSPRLQTDRQRFAAGMGGLQPNPADSGQCPAAAGEGCRFAGASVSASAGRDVGSESAQLQRL